MMFTISLLSLMALLSLSTSNAAEQNLRGLVVDPPLSWTGNCLNNEVCNARDVSLQSVTTSSSITSCVAGSKVTIPITAKFEFKTKRYDFGLFLGLNGSANSGDTCAIAPLLEEYSASYTATSSASIKWDMDTNGANDVCGDMIFNGSNQYLTMNNIFSDVEIECKAGANGKLLLPLCFSWKQPGGDTECTLGDLTAGTTAKCGCSDVSLDTVSVTDCEDSETEKTINVGGNSALRSATKTSNTKRILLPQGATIGFDYVTNTAFDAYKVSSWFEFARSKESFSYFFEDAAFLNSCYDYDIILGFAELEDKYCTGNADEPNRIMKILVNAGEGDVVVRPDFNVVDKTGGECFQAYMIKYTVTPTAATIGITVEKTEESNGDAILSFIKIMRSAQRRLGADCNKGQVV